MMYKSMNNMAPKYLNDLSSHVHPSSTHGIYEALMSIYEALMSIYEALMSIYEALMSIYESQLWRQIRVSEVFLIVSLPILLPLRCLRFGNHGSLVRT